MDRKITDNPALHAIFCLPLALARRAHEQRQLQRGRKIYSPARTPMSS